MSDFLPICELQGMHVDVIAGTVIADAELYSGHPIIRNTLVEVFDSTSSDLVRLKQRGKRTHNLTGVSSI
ncbi:hypothetical protein C5167_023513 [Papaver somniferum]|uniref:Uncharacterized protein n=1 Tax=Papaver somniferum TaxID=3469 RepID=A0A4Y7JNZ0_PAPSO|nr:hypothetical protein C5167_023513 [Papaver somniferum]